VSMRITYFPCPFSRPSCPQSLYLSPNAEAASSSTPILPKMIWSSICKDISKAFVRAIGQSTLQMCLSSSLTSGVHHLRGRRLLVMAGCGMWVLAEAGVRVSERMGKGRGRKGN